MIDPVTGQLITLSDLRIELGLTLRAIHLAERNPRAELFLRALAERARRLESEIALCEGKGTKPWTTQRSLT